MAKTRTDRQRTSAILDELAEVGPAGLVVDVLQVDDEHEEFAIFTWGSAPATIATLTKAEHEVLALVLQGASNAEIATRRECAVRTVANQVASLLRKLRAKSRFDLIRQLGGEHGSRRES